MIFCSPAVEDFGGNSAGILVFIDDGGISVPGLNQAAEEVIAEGSAGYSGQCALVEILPSWPVP